MKSDKGLGRATFARLPVNKVARLRFATIALDEDAVFFDFKGEISFPSSTISYRLQSSNSI
jgi:hypothetical protein